MKVGRNDLCPCGSGVKSQKCCAVKTDPDPYYSPHIILTELRKILDRPPDEATAYVASVLQKKKEEGREELAGLSPGQMHRFLYYPYESPHLATFPARVAVETLDAPILTLFTLLTTAIGERGVKPTVTGNLPRKLCQEIATVYWGEEEYRRYTSFGEIRSEVEFVPLNVTRMVAEMAGLIRKYRGRFILGRECRKIMADRGPTGAYPRLFRTFVSQYDWSYGDCWEGSPLIQQSFLFSLFLLTKHGGDWRSNRFYEDSFLRAFPSLLREVKPMGNTSSEQLVRTCYSGRCLESFAGLLGLVESERVEWDYAEFRLRKRPLLDSVVQFHLAT